jgi:hypothetical protein
VQIRSWYGSRISSSSIYAQLLTKQREKQRQQRRSELIRVDAAAREAGRYLLRGEI